MTRNASNPAFWRARRGFFWCLCGLGLENLTFPLRKRWRVWNYKMLNAIFNIDVWIPSLGSWCIQVHSVYCHRESFWLPDVASSETTREVVSNPERECRVSAQWFFSIGGIFPCTLPKPSSEIGRWGMKDTFHWFLWDIWDNCTVKYLLRDEVVNESILFGRVNVKFFSVFIATMA